MSKQKVRPMVDKELRDEVVGYLCGAGSFNEALRWYIKGCKQLFAKNREQAKSITRLKGEIAELKKNNSELSTTLDGTDKAYKSLFELYMEKKDRGFIYFCLGNAIGAAVMTFVFNVM